ALVSIADHAYFLRDLSLMSAAADALASLGTQGGYRGIGLYYEPISFARQGKGTTARSHFQRDALKAAPGNKARAIMPISLNYAQVGDIDTAFRLSLEALRAASYLDTRRELVPTASVQLNMSILCSQLGDHKGALRLLDGLAPIARAAAKAC